MNGKLNKNIGFSMLPFAFLFMFEPGITILDPLPDCIGYIIICFAIRNLADINYKIDEAFVGFRKGIMISAARFPAIYLLDSYFIESEQSVGVLLFVFAFSFFELIVLIPAFRSFFEGLLSLGVLHDGSAVYFKKLKKIKLTDQDGNECYDIKESKRNITEKAYFLTAAFLIVKGCAVTIPEFTSLSTNSSYEFVSLLRIFGFLIAAPIGIVWLIKMIIYCIKVRNDDLFISNLCAVYKKNSLENPNIYVVRKISVGLISLIVAFIASMNTYSDYIDLIPNYCFYIVVIIASLFLKKHSKKWLAIVITGSIGCVLGYISHIFTVAFHSEFYPAAIRKSLEAYYAYYKMLTLHAIDAVIMQITVLLVLLMLWDVYKVHSDVGIVENHKEYRLYKGKFVKQSVIIYITSIISSASEVYYIFAQPFYYLQNWYFYYSAIISVSLSLVFVFAICYFIGFVNNSVRYRYRVDM